MTMNYLVKLWSASRPFAIQDRVLVACQPKHGGAFLQRSHIKYSGIWYQTIFRPFVSSLNPSASVRVSENWDGQKSLSLPFLWLPSSVLSLIKNTSSAACRTIFSLCCFFSCVDNVSEQKQKNAMWKMYSCKYFFNVRGAHAFLYTRWGTLPQPV